MKEYNNDSNVYRYKQCKNTKRHSLSGLILCCFLMVMALAIGLYPKDFPFLSDLQPKARFITDPQPNGRLISDRQPGAHLSIDRRDGGYERAVNRMVADGLISTRGLT